mmetsp:Transcript_24569/g.48859  ORF Transcript_24569/g.48859 Transcript_24569/m.48859 type:complete len:420 (+) Transcript_24569:100-1359(+)
MTMMMARCQAVRHLLTVTAAVVSTLSTASAFTAPLSLSTHSGSSCSSRPSVFNNLPSSATTSRWALLASSSDDGGAKTTLFFADDATNKQNTANNNSDDDDNSNPQSATRRPPPSERQPSSSPLQLFSSETLAEANDALANVGWTSRPDLVGAQDDDGDLTLTSDDPFVQQIDRAIQSEMGVSLDQLLNPAKVVNLERDLFNLRVELARLTDNDDFLRADFEGPLTTEMCDSGGGGEGADAVRAKIAKKEKDLAIERRSVFRGWLKNVFLFQALLSAVLSYVMATSPATLFGRFDWYNNVANMDTSITVLGFWWWWLFIVPSLRSRRPTGLEKRALDVAFLGTPIVSLLSPVVTKDTGVIWWVNFALVAGAYGYFYLVVGEENDDGDDGEGGGKNDPAWLKFVYKSLDFGSGRERGARR